MQFTHTITTNTRLDDHHDGGALLLREKCHHQSHNFRTAADHHLVECCNNVKPAASVSLLSMTVSGGDGKSIQWSASMTFRRDCKTLPPYVHRADVTAEKLGVQQQHVIEDQRGRCTRGRANRPIIPLLEESREPRAQTNESSTCSMSEDEPDGLIDDPNDLGFDFQLCANVYQSWELVKSLENYKRRFGIGVLSLMAAEEPLTMELLLNAGDEFDFQREAQLADLITAILDDLVAALGPMTDADALADLGSRCEQKGFNTALFQSLGSSVCRVLDELLPDMTSEQRESWVTFLRCAVMQMTRVTL